MDKHKENVGIPGANIVEILSLIWLLIKQVYLNVLYFIIDSVCKLLGVDEKYDYRLGVDQGKDGKTCYVLFRIDKKTGTMTVINEKYEE